MGSGGQSLLDLLVSIRATAPIFPCSTASAADRFRISRHILRRSASPFLRPESSGSQYESPDRSSWDRSTTSDAASSRIQRAYPRVCWSFASRAVINEAMVAFTVSRFPWAAGDDINKNTRSRAANAVGLLVLLRDLRALVRSPFSLSL